MIQDTLQNIQARVEGLAAMDDAKRRELLRLLDTLKTEVVELSKTEREHAESIARFAEISAHEATRQEKRPELQRISLEGLSASVEGFEATHPRLVKIVNSVCVMLSNLGI
jgi:low affinity Fe/Cu permease